MTEEKEKSVNSRVIGLRLNNEEITELSRETSTANGSNMLRVIIDQWKAQKRELKRLIEENTALREQIMEFRDKLILRHHDDVLSDILKISGILGLIFLILFLVSRMHGG